DRVTDLTQFGVEANADQIGGIAAGAVAGGIAVHTAISALRTAQKKVQDRPSAAETSKEEA
ncbi:hypothetical protein JI667_21660, partial [Bacillus sp. NTK074B]|nr:hypothetical protein [Bacillus sp. NTK074B]